MSYRIGKVRYQNFGPYEDAEVDFSQEGVTAIEGWNGSGKSMLVNGIVWSVWNRCVQERYKGDDVIRHGQKSCSVRVELDGGTSSIVIERFRKHPKHGDRVYLMTNGSGYTSSPGTNPETEAAIERLIGLDFISFVNSVAFGSRDEVKGFFAATDSTRKGVLESLLGLGRYAAAEVIAKQKHKKISDSLSQKQAELERTKQSVEHLTQMVRTLKDDGESRNLQSELDALKLQCKQIKDATDNADKAVKSAHAKFVKEEMAYKAKESIYTTEWGKWEAAQLKLQGKIQERQRESAALEGEAKADQKRVDAIAKLKGEQCPTCQQSVSAKYVAAALAEMQNRAKSLMHQSEALGLEVIGLQREYESESDKEPELPDESVVDAAREEKRVADGKLQMAKERLQSINAQVSQRQQEIDLKVGKVKAAQDALDAAKGQIRVLEGHCEKVSVQRDDLAFWVEGYSNRGLKSFLLEAELNQINHYATVFTHRFLGVGAEVRMTATRELKGGGLKEELTTAVTIPGCTISYAGASKGQKTRLDLCLLLAFWKLTRTRAVRAFDTLLIDEVFDGLDADGSEAVADLLIELGQTMPVTVISHDNRLRSIANRVISVNHNKSKTNPVATLSEQSA